ncbi:MAG: helix-hairpin-helix domain-containing protein [Bacteroidales bacterium]|nr:helix-hairpin-helix domain-containing protein [Bacteroidales bacterium]
MRHTNQSWIRLGKNLSTLIVVTLLATFFFVYKPQKKHNYNEQTDTIVQFNSDTLPHIVKQPKHINPNTATLEDFLEIGLTRIQASNCINYRNKGGHFYKKDDLKKIYSISEDDYARIEPFITIPKTNNPVEIKTTNNKKTVTKTINTVNINVCDTTELMQLPKIGSFRARKIIERRERLGGFYSVEQLCDINSLDSSVVAEIRAYIIIDTAAIRKINVNTASFKEIVAHPLISYEQTKKIMQYKSIVKNISNPDELLINNILEREEYEKIKFYIKTF